MVRLKVREILKAAEEDYERAWKETARLPSDGNLRIDGLARCLLNSKPEEDRMFGDSSS